MTTRDSAATLRRGSDGSAGPTRRRTGPPDGRGGRRPCRGLRRVPSSARGSHSLHGALDRVDYERLNVDLWPAVRQRLAADPSSRAAETWALLGLTAALVAWRLAQLLLEWPAPVVNSIVPLVLIVVVLRRVTGDPFAIQSSSHLRPQEGVS